MMQRPKFSLMIFLFADTASIEIYTLSLHDALPICNQRGAHSYKRECANSYTLHARRRPDALAIRYCFPRHALQRAFGKRSEEHTSELQSRRDLVCRLLLEKKKILFLRSFYRYKK